MPVSSIVDRTTATEEPRFAPLEPRSREEPALEFRIEEETPGMVKWRVRRAGALGLEFVVSLMGSTITKMEGLHGRKLTPEDLTTSIYRAVRRAQRYLENRKALGGEPSGPVTVTVRDSDLAELGGSRVGPTNDVPP